MSTARGKISGGCGALVALCASAIVAAENPATSQPGPRGAVVPYVHYEAESGTTTGGAVVVGPNRKVGDLAGEASGREAVKLAATGDGVEWKVTGPANSLVVRYSIPDSADGKGIDATLSIYLNGERRGSIELTSRYAWLYGPEENPQNNPGLGSPRRIYDEAHKLLDFKMQAGDTLALKKDAGDGAAYYGIDFVELEEVPPPKPCPEGFINVADVGVTAENFGEKIGPLIQSFAGEGRKGKKGIYIPPGRYKMEAQALIPKECAGIEITGAGMWHTVLYDARGKEADWGTPGFNLNGVSARFSDFAIFGSGSTRAGGGKPFVNSYGTGSVFRNIWIEHMTCGFWVGSGQGVTNRLTIDGCRLRNLGADGINLCNGTKNSTVVNTTVRGSGDDGIAIWSAPEMDEPIAGVDYAGCANNVIQNCTVELPWRASAFAIYGGKDNTIRNCIARDTLTYPGVNISSSFKPRAFAGWTLIENVLVERCGGAFWKGRQFGAVWVMADDSMVTGVTFRNVEVVEPTYAGILLQSETYNKGAVAEMSVDFEQVKVVRPGAQGILIRDAVGAARFKGSQVLEVGGKAIERIKDSNGKKETGTVKILADEASIGLKE